jgi:hypothetical protein
MNLSSLHEFEFIGEKNQEISCWVITFMSKDLIFISFFIWGVGMVRFEEIVILI